MTEEFAIRELSAFEIDMVAGGDGLVSSLIDLIIPDCKPPGATHAG